MQTTLILKREIKKKTINDASNSKSTKKRKRSAYTNLFAPQIWPLILATVKKHGDLISAFHYLKTFHRKPGKICAPYEKLSRGSLYEWFTPRTTCESCYKEEDNFHRYKKTFFNS
jgi:hypothetical protein